VFILVPGIGTLATTSYHFLAPLLIADGFRVVMMDLPGLGQSSVDFDTSEYSATAVGDDIVALIKHLNLSSTRKVLIFGNSMAAAAAVWCVNLGSWSFDYC